MFVESVVITSEDHSFDITTFDDLVVQQVSVLFNRTLVGEPFVTEFAFELLLFTTLVLQVLRQITFVLVLTAAAIRAVVAASVG